MTDIGLTDIGMSNLVLSERDPKLPPAGLDDRRAMATPGTGRILIEKSRLVLGGFDSSGRTCLLRVPDDVSRFLSTRVTREVQFQRLA